MRGGTIRDLSRSRPRLEAGERAGGRGEREGDGAGVSAAAFEVRKNGGVPTSALPTAPASRRHEVLLGIKDSLGVGIGIFPLGMALGILVVQAGLPAWVAPALSIGIFAGSVELLLVSMLAAATPIVAIAVMVFVVNFRHVFYAFSFPLTKVSKGLPRAYSVYALIDEAYATYSLMPREKLTSPRILAGQVAMQCYWVAGGIVGLLIAGALPAPIEGFEFALASLFIVMTLDAIRSKREIPSALLAGLAVTVSIVTVPDQAMLVAIALFVAMLAARYLLRSRTHTDTPDDAA